MLTRAERQPRGGHRQSSSHRRSSANVSSNCIAQLVKCLLITDKWVRVWMGLKWAPSGGLAIQHTPGP